MKHKSTLTGKAMTNDSMDDDFGHCSRTLEAALQLFSISWHPNTAFTHDAAVDKLRFLQEKTRAKLELYFALCANLQDYFGLGLFWSVVKGTDAGGTLAEQMSLRRAPTWMPNLNW